MKSKDLQYKFRTSSNFCYYSIYFWWRRFSWCKHHSCYFLYLSSIFHNCCITFISEINSPVFVDSMIQKLNSRVDNSKTSFPKLLFSIPEPSIVIAISFKLKKLITFLDLVIIDFTLTLLLQNNRAFSSLYLISFWCCKRITISNMILLQSMYLKKKWWWHPSSFLHVWLSLFPGIIRLKMSEDDCIFTKVTQSTLNTHVDGKSK